MDTTETLPDFDEFWQKGAPAEVEVAFRELLPLAESSGDDSYHGALLTQIARTYSLRGLFDEAHALLDQVEGMQTAVSAKTWSRYLLERGRSYNSASQPETAVPLFADALRFAQEASADYFAIDAVHMLAIASPPEGQISWANRGLEMVAQTADAQAKKWGGPLLNNLGWSYHDLGRYEEALATFQESLVWRRAYSQDKPHTIRIAHWCVGRALRSLGRIEEALATQQDVLQAWEAAGEEDGFVHEEIGECLLALERSGEARPYFADAYRLLSQVGWVAADHLQRLQTLSRAPA